MADLDKVMDGLNRCAVSMRYEDAFEGCKGCPYDSISIVVQDCRSVLCQDAMDVIRALAEVPDVQKAGV